MMKGSNGEADAMASVRDVSTACEMLAEEYERHGYPTYARLAREGKGDFTLCSIRAIDRALKSTPSLSAQGEAEISAEARPEAQLWSIRRLLDNLIVGIQAIGLNDAGDDEVRIAAAAQEALINAIEAAIRTARPVSRPDREVAVLRELEWTGPGGNCPVCRAPRPYGHYTDCRLAAALVIQPPVPIHPTLSTEPHDG